MFKKSLVIVLGFIALTTHIHAIEWVNGLSGTFSCRTEETDNPDIIRRVFETAHHRMKVDLPGERAPMTLSGGLIYVRADDPETDAIIVVHIFQAKNKLSYQEVRRELLEAFGSISEEHKGKYIHDTYFITEEVDEYGNQFYYKWYIAHNFLFNVFCAATGPDYEAQIDYWYRVLETVVWEKL